MSAATFDIPQAPASETGDLPPGTWRGLRTADGRRSALVRCPNGHFGTLTGHDIDDQGIVKPSIGCPEWPENCDFHVWGRLLDWTPEREFMLESEEPPDRDLVEEDGE